MSRPRTTKGGAPAATRERRPASLMTSTATNTTPIVRGFVTPARGGAWLLVVPRCPFCRGRHVHGAPAGPATVEGRRLSHCAGGARSYRIIVMPEGAE